MLTEILQKVYYQNTVLDYIISVSIFAAALFIINIFRRIVLNRLKKAVESTETIMDDFIIKQVEKLAIPIIYFASLYLSIKYLTLTKQLEKAIDGIFVVIITIFTIRMLISITNFSITRYLEKQKGKHFGQIKGISTFVAIIIWGIGLVFLLDNLGLKVSAVVTGLGIGGIAVALAAQTILGDLFSYFVIFFDRPFEVGDFIMVDNKLGAVEHIGIKTTRIKSLSGEQLVFANKDLTDSRIHNFKKMEKRRVAFSLGVTYQASLKTLEKIPSIIRKVIEGNEDAIFDRAHFRDYGNFSLNFEIVYYVIGADYNKYMDIQQNINLHLFEEFNKHKIEFAYPTQTLFVTKENYERAAN